VFQAEGERVLLVDIGERLDTRVLLEAGSDRAGLGG
jgi:hypothetical protein